MIMSRKQIAGPDFICVGMPKAGTGWLFDQLNNHPEFWLPPVKGLHYFGHRNPRMANATKQLLKSGRGRGAVRAKGRAGEERDLAFLREASAVGGQPRDLARYAALFRFKEDKLSGDISAPYADLREDDISEIANALPETKIILLVRDPVARAASRISMAYRRGDFDPQLLDDPDAFRKFINSVIFLGEERSNPTQIVARWAKAAPNLQFRSVLFDDIENEPEKARAEILFFLGADPEKRGEIPAGHNHKAGAVKIALTPSAKAILVERFKDEIFACGRMFGGQATKWPAKYGL